MNHTTVHSEPVKVTSIPIDWNDTIQNKILSIYTDSDGYPIKYSRDVITGVCIDGECRLVKINLFWNLTGRYLGFELPEGEFLSKTKHVTFKPEDYDKIHNVLSEANSPLANYSIDELVPKKSTNSQGVDAVSSATIAAVLDHIVEGAVYTTYTLWHIVNGPTKREIEKLTTEKLDSDLSLKILNSINLQDQVWVLNHISAEMEMSEEFQKKLMDFISEQDIYLAERALNVLKPETISAEIQLKLGNLFKQSGFLQKRLILQKLKETDELIPELVKVLSAELNNLNGTLTKNVLDLYKLHSIKDEYTVSEVAKLLKNENRYISGQAYRYLENMKQLDKKTQKSLEKYQKRNT
ncbi:hypothetical protein OU798_17470 [Prolixibacteraceae bacterium Z1-6]|uniref:Uncharacterized protein n=1 Tax=Draconibacterium aestuarii TaxID=2998507 RepID=A0A9X3F9G7_9BACT|nr:hypothetical protein [Prolixibacteraceae bacterium Z1-6]